MYLAGLWKHGHAKVQDRSSGKVILFHSGLLLHDVDVDGMSCEDQVIFDLTLYHVGRSFVITEFIATNPIRCHGFIV